MKTSSKKSSMPKNRKTLGKTQTVKKMSAKRKELVRRAKKRVFLMPNILPPIVKKRKNRILATQKKNPVQMSDKGIQTDSVDQDTQTTEYYNVIIENNPFKIVKTEQETETEILHLETSDTENNEENIHLQGSITENNDTLNLQPSFNINNEETLHLQANNTQNNDENKSSVKRVIREVFKKNLGIKEEIVDEDGTIIEIKRERRTKQSLKAASFVAKDVVKNILVDFEVFDKEDQLLYHNAWNPRSKVYQCAVCKFSTPHLTSYKIHKDIHDGVKYECSACLHKASSRGGLLNHMRSSLLCRPHLDPKLQEKKTRTPRKIFRCSKCEYECGTKQLLTHHQIIHLPKDQLPQFRCEFCDFVATRKNNFMRHKRLRHANDIGFNAETLYCYHCDYNTKYKSNLVDHIKRHFKERKIYACSYCPLTYMYKMAYLQHEECHKREGLKFQCPYRECTYWVPKKYMLKKHMIKHKNEHEVKMFHCPNCSHRTKYRASFRAHLERMCNISYTDWQKEYENVPVKNKPDDENEKKTPATEADQGNTSDAEWEFSLSDQEI